MDNDESATNDELGSVESSLFQNQEPIGILQIPRLADYATETQKSLTEQLEMMSNIFKSYCERATTSVEVVEKNSNQLNDINQELVGKKDIIDKWSDVVGRVYSAQSATATRPPDPCCSDASSPRPSSSVDNEMNEETPGQ